METKQDLRLAVLIDADNVPSSQIKGMLEEIAKYGTPTFKRIYADWTKPTVSGWKNVLLEYAITPIQQYSYTSGKNSSDSALIIDAMDILYTGRVDGFCIVSSDSDFTRLATRLREAGMKVFGMGARKTPAALISACDKFIYLEILKIEEKEKSSAPVSKAPVKRRQAMQEKKIISPEMPVVETPAIAAANNAIVKVDEPLIQLITDSINDIAEEDGWVFLGELGNLILKKKPDFDARNYGHKKLLSLIKSINRFDVDERSSGKNNITHVYVRNR